MNRTLTALRTRLERSELAHLRQLVADLHDRLEKAEAAAESAEESAHFWQRHAMDLQQSLHDDSAATHLCVGIAKTGEMMVVDRG